MRTAAGTLRATKGISVSDNSIPRPSGAQPLTPPPAPGYADAPPPAQPQPQPQPQPTQAYPGAAPSYSPPPALPYGAPPQTPAAPPQPTYVVAPGQPGYAPYGAQSGYPAPVAKPASGLAIASLICGIAGVVLFWAVIPFLASVAAVITGHMALGQTKRNPAIGGRGMAFAGLILGYIMVGVAAITIVTAVIGFLFMGAFTLPFIFAS